MKYFVYIALFILCNTSVFAKDNFALAKAYVEEGDRLSKSNKLSEALSLYQLAIIESPQNPSCHAIIAGCYFNLRQYANAIYHCEKAEQLGLETPTLYGNLGLIYGFIAYDKDALAYFDKIDIYNSNVFLNKGAILERNGQTQEALKYMHRSIKLNSIDIPMPLFNIGVIYEHMNQSDSAIYYYKKTIDRFPEHYAAYQALASILKKTGHSKHEYEYLCKVVLDKIPASSNDLDDMMLRSDAFEVLGNKTEMKKLLQKLLPEYDKYVTLYPRSYSFISKRGDIHQGLDNIRAAKADYKRALELNSKYYEAREALKEIENNQQ